MYRLIAEASRPGGVSAMDTSRTSMIKFSPSNSESGSDCFKKMYCSRLPLRITECMNTSVLDCAVTFTCDKNVCVYGIQKSNKRLPRYLLGSILYPNPKKGTQNTNADAISRVEIHTKETEDFCSQADDILRDTNNYNKTKTDLFQEPNDTHSANPPIDSFVETIPILIDDMDTISTKKHRIFERLPETHENETQISNNHVENDNDEDQTVHSNNEQNPVFEIPIMGTAVNNGLNQIIISSVLHSPWKPKIRILFGKKKRTFLQLSQNNFEKDTIGFKKIHERKKTENKFKNATVLVSINNRRKTLTRYFMGPRSKNLDNNPGLIPLKIGNAKIQESSHRLEHLQYSAFKFGNKPIENLVTPIRRLDKEKSEKVENKLTEILPHPSRTKRGLINGLGLIFEAISGNVDASDGERYEKLIDQLQKNQKELASNIRSENSLSIRLINEFDKTDQNIVRNEKLIESKINQITKIDIRWLQDEEIENAAVIYYSRRKIIVYYLHGMLISYLNDCIIRLWLMLQTSSS
ncbi:unnamed protein product [Phaedon cochleariae]|uniref:Uncharacterized protein n=1 Tax=Phaedon cochleariae TaxID=80249 RepID=A0A9N9SD94_PHACE|nr:unnamed protein product [Phaedon cochleariae]